MDKSESSDLLLACSIGDLAWLKRGLSTEKVNVAETRSPEGLTCLHLSVKNGHLECMKFLLDNCSIDVNEIVIVSGNTALHYSVSTRNSSKNFLCMKLLLDRGANIKMKNKDGQTVLHFASKCGDVKCLKYLLGHGSDLQDMDNDGHTALKYALLHSHHECARLLKALEWAKEKERLTNEMLLDNEEILKHKHKIRLQEMQIKGERAGHAYNNWLQRKAYSNAKTQSPHACRQRLEARKQSDSPMCVTCTKVVTKKHITRPRSKPIKLNTKQVKRNLKGIGKPYEMHPYTNGHLQSSPRSYSSIGSSCITRSTSLRSSQCTSRSSLKYLRNTKSASVNHGKKQVETKIQSPVSKPELRSTSDALHDDRHKCTSADNGKVFTFLPEETDSDEEDSLFHDVGDTNNLQSLALPNVVTKGKTPVEVLQLFRRLSTPSLNHSFSVSSGKNQHHRAKYQRRFSLGSIPEGRIVTNYTEDASMSSDSQLLDSNFLEKLIRSFSTDNSLQLEADNQERNRFSDEESVEDMPTTSNNVVYSVESEESLSSGSSSHVNESSDEQAVLESLPPMDIKQDCLTPPMESCRLVSPPNSLKIVNLAWNTETNMVESQITLSPFSAQKHVGVNSQHKTPSPGKDEVSPIMHLSTKSVPESFHDNEVDYEYFPCNGCQGPRSSKHATCAGLDYHFQMPVQSEPETSVEIRSIDVDMPKHRNFLASKSTLLNRPKFNSSQTVVHKRVKSAPV